MTRDDLKRFRALDIDFSSIGLMYEEFAYFCTPIDAEYVGWIGCDGVHFILLPGDERVFCVEPTMGDGFEETFVLPVGEDFREFLSFVLFCQGADRLAQIHWFEETELLRGLEADMAWVRENPALLASKEAALAAIAREFSLSPASPFGKVKALQANFDRSILHFSDKYYDTLGLERP